MGRPSSFTQEIADQICERISSGESLKAICAEEGMPAHTTVFRWLRAEDGIFRTQYARAREDQAERMLDEIIEISDESSADTITKRNSDGSEYEVVDSEWIARSRLRVDARKWAMSKLAPKKYGDKIEHTGAEGGPIIHKVEFVIIDEKGEPQ